MSLKGMPTEIERKWYMSKEYLCNLESSAWYVENFVKTSKLIQYYYSPDIRMRSVDNKVHTLTVKSGEGMVRKELEVEISSMEYIRYSYFAEKVLIKTRAYFKDGLVLDIPKGEDFCIIEKEFDSEDEALSYTLPEGVKVNDPIDVTGDGLWSGYMIAKEL